MKRLMMAAVVLTAFSATATAAAAQEPADTVPGPVLSEAREIVRESGLETAVDSMAKASLPELENALERLTGTLDILARRIANDPELRASALRTAGGLIVLTERVVAEQSEVLLEVLRTAAKDISTSPLRDGSDPSVRE